MDVDTIDIKSILNKLLVEIQEINKRMEFLNHKTQALGKSCHAAFMQIREAMGCLREDLAESSGTLIQDTWLD
jgi:hypothetical protein